MNDSKPYFFIGGRTTAGLIRRYGLLDATFVFNDEQQSEQFGKTNRRETR